MAATAPMGIQHGANILYKLFDNVNDTQLVHKICIGSIRLFSAMSQNPVASGLGKLAEMMGSTNLIINGTQVLPYGSYFFRKKGEEEVPRKLCVFNGEITEAEQEKRVFKVRHTPFGYELARKPQRAFAGIAFFSAYFVCTIELLESIKIPVLKTVSSAMGSIPILGEVIGNNLPHYLFAFGGYAVIAGHTALVFDSISYLQVARSDPSKSMVKGFLQLASRIASLAFDFFVISGVSNPLVIGALGVTAGVFGIAYLVHKYFRQNQKAQEQEALYAVAEAQNPL